MHIAVDGQPITTHEYMDINPEQLQRALSFVQYDVSATPVDQDEYELEELKRDAALLITAYKMIGDVPCGISIFSMEDPTWRHMCMSQNSMLVWVTVG